MKSKLVFLAFIAVIGMTMSLVNNLIEEKAAEEVKIVETELAYFEKMQNELRESLLPDSLKQKMKIASHSPLIEGDDEGYWRTSKELREVNEFLNTFESWRYTQRQIDLKKERQIELKRW